MATTKTLKISLERARALLVQLGLPTAKRLGAAGALGKLSTLDAEDDTADPGKYKKLYARVCDANANGTEIVVVEGDKPASKAKTRKAPAKARAGKAATKKSTRSKASTKAAPKKKKGEPGVFDRIAEALQKATAKKPVTKDDVLAHLVKYFPDREEDKMKVTVNAQIPTRIQSSRGITVHKNENGYWAN